jgi:hypothetical protein
MKQWKDAAMEAMNTKAQAESHDVLVSLFSNFHCDAHSLCSQEALQSKRDLACGKTFGVDVPGEPNAHYRVGPRERIRHLASRPILVKIDSYRLWIEQEIFWL